MTRTSNNCLADQIAAAGSAAEIQELLAKGRTYFAGKRTRRNWHRVARHRLEELQQEQEEAARV